MILFINIMAAIFIVIFIDQSCVVSHVNHRPRYEPKREIALPHKWIIGKQLSVNGDSVYVISTVTIDTFVSYQVFYQKSTNRYEHGR